MKRYLIPAALCVILALFFIFGLVGYSFLGLCFLGLAVLLLMFMGLKLMSKKHKKAAKGLKIALISVLAVLFTAAAVTEGYIISGAMTGASGERCAIVLGAGVNGTVPSLSLKKRLEAALEYAGDNPEAVLILSGGQGGGEDISEAQCMYNWLTARGVEPERLIMEDRSTSTKENLTFSMEILCDLGAENERVAIITAGYHITRASLMAADLGYGEISAKAAPAGYVLLELNYYLREIPAIWWYLITG